MPGQGPGTPDSARSAASAAAEPRNPYLAAIEKHSSKMDSLAKKTGVEDMKSAVLVQTKTMIAEAVDPLKDEFASFKARVTILEQQPRTASDKELARKVGDIEAQLAGLKLQAAHVGGTVAVVGGLQSASSAEVAKQWLRGEMAKVSIDGVVDVYDKCKGQDFNGMLFVKSGSNGKRETAISLFNSVRKSFADAPSYMNKDLPLQQRAKFSFLLNFKKLLAVWKFENISFDDASGVLKVAGKPVLEATIDDFTLKLTWLDAGWGEWDELTKDPKLIQLHTTAEDKLKKASESQNKGKGKASPH